LFKAFIAEGGIRSPLIMTGPGVSRTGETVHAVAHVMDIAATLLDLSGTDYPSVYDGRNIAPLRGKSMLPLLEKRGAVLHGPDEPLAWEFNGWRAIRMGDMKAAWISRPFGAGEWQLFDVATDPGESIDLSRKEPELLQQFISAWAEYANDVGVVLPEEADWPDH
jgi:arylsulfatase